MTAREKILTLAKSIESLYDTIYEIDERGCVQFTDEFKKSLPIDDVDEYYKTQDELTRLTKENQYLNMQLKIKDNIIDQNKKEILSLKHKLSRALTNNIKMCEHIKELHKDDNIIKE